ncbi:MAG: hypothetical protein LBE03_01525 [Candidatus Nomurabacteria bacterium]|jgi:hypothetical protein|nr:hypothetical protein [Candidatus Nomurabacteria bacterium]
MKRGQKQAFYQEPKKCWVNDKEKICYENEDEAEMAARHIEVTHKLPKGSLKVYKCDFGEHWHIASNKNIAT